MKKLLSLALCAVVSPTIWATDITAIFGAGNPNTGWTTVSGPNGILLGLRAKDRSNASTANVAGTYTFATPLDPANAARAIFNYEFSISTSLPLVGLPGAAYDFYLSADTNSSAGITYNTINPLLAFNDNSYGVVGVTANSAGDEGTFATYGASSNLAQNSENIAFIPMPVNVANATYNYELYAVTAGAGSGGARQASVGITVVVGQGGAAVPDGGSSAILLALGLVGVVGFKSRRKRATT